MLGGEWHTSVNWWHVQWGGGDSWSSSTLLFTPFSSAMKERNDSFGVQIFLSRTTAQTDGLQWRPSSPGPSLTSFCNSSTMCHASFASRLAPNICFILTDVCFSHLLRMPKPAAASPPLRRSKAKMASMTTDAECCLLATAYESGHVILWQITMPPTDK